MDLKQRKIKLDFKEVLNKLTQEPEQGDWVLAIDPDSCEAKIVVRDKKGFVADVLGHEDLFPLSMVTETQDGFIVGGDWLVAYTPEIRVSDGEYRSYWVDWQDQDESSEADKAKEFLQMARHDGIAAQTSYYPFIICYLCHQRTEKFLKAYLAYHGRAIPKTHDIERLIGLCAQVEPSFNTLRVPSEILRPYGIDIRYTSDKSQADTDCYKVWEFCQQTADFVRQFLPWTEPLSGTRS
jgi:HEPN domain-containing protein